MLNQFVSDICCSEILGGLGEFPSSLLPAVTLGVQDAWVGVFLEVVCSQPPGAQVRHNKHYLNPCLVVKAQIRFIVFL